MKWLSEPLSGSRLGRSTQPESERHPSGTRSENFEQSYLRARDRRAPARTRTPRAASIAYESRIPVTHAPIHRKESVRTLKSIIRRGVQFVEGDGVAQDYAEAARFYPQAPAAGYAPAQYDLAYLYEKGLGVTAT